MTAVMLGLLLGIVLLAVVGAAVYSIFLRRHGESEAPISGWVATDEVFRDPTTNRLMRVWVDPSDGSRHYVHEGRLPGSF